MPAARTICKIPLCLQVASEEKVGHCKHATQTTLSLPCTVQVAGEEKVGYRKRSKREQ